jgi:hypothetical protein
MLCVLKSDRGLIDNGVEQKGWQGVDGRGGAHQAVMTSEDDDLLAGRGDPDAGGRVI